MHRVSDERADVTTRRPGFCFVVRGARLVVHELTLMNNIVAAASRAVGASRVHVVRVRVGQRTCVSVRALRFCFEVCVKGTPLDGAVLEIVETEGEELRVEEVEVS